MGTTGQQGLAAVVLVLTVACGTKKPPPPPPPALEPEVTVVPPPRHTTGALTQAERDSILRDLVAHRDAWRARNISDYRMVVAVGCFCPWPSTPLILDVRGGTITQLLDTLGKPAGPVREPWSRYTVEGLFDAVEQGVKRSDVIEIAYDARYDYPASIRGNARVGLPDNWFWVKASRLTPRR
jgi:hypothetical protein